MVTRGSALSLACGACLLLVSSRAVAQARAALTYDAPAGCPTADEARARLEALLLSAPEGELPAIASDIEIARDATGYAASVVMREADYEDRRALRDEDCALLAEAAVLVVAVALVPGLVPAATTPPSPAPPRREESEDAEPTVTPDTRTMLGSVWLALHTSYGVLPGVAVGGELGGSIALESLRIDAAVRGLPFVGARFGGSPLLGGDIAQVVGLLRARGVGVPIANLELALGGGLEAGAALGTGVGLSDPRSASAPWVAIEAAAGIAWVPSPYVAVFLEIEALVPVVRPVFTVAGIGVLYRPEPVGGALRVALELRIP